MMLVDPLTRKPLGPIVAPPPQYDEDIDLACPRCGAAHWQRQQWRWEASPTQYKRDCYVCGWTSGWGAWAPEEGE